MKKRGMWVGRKERERKWIVWTWKLVSFDDNINVEATQEAGDAFYSLEGGHPTSERKTVVKTPLSGQKRFEEKNQPKTITSTSASSSRTQTNPDPELDFWATPSWPSLKPAISSSDCTVGELDIDRIRNPQTSKFENSIYLVTKTCYFQAWTDT